DDLCRRVAKPVRRRHRRGGVRPEAAEEDREGSRRAGLHRDSPRDGVPFQRRGNPRMKLRTQFFILVGGIIAVPFLVSALVLVVQLGLIPGREPLPNYDQIRSWVTGHVPRAVHRHDLAALMDNRPPGLDILILDRNLAVTTSTI